MSQTARDGHASRPVRGRSVTWAVLRCDWAVTCAVTWAVILAALGGRVGLESKESATPPPRRRSAFLYRATLWICVTRICAGHAAATPERVPCRRRLAL